MKTVYKLGVTIYDPDKCFNGYTLFPYPFLSKVLLIDMNGNKVRDWDLRAIRVKLLENGNIITVARKRGRDSGWKTGRNSIQELDWGGNLVWEYIPPGNVHHDCPFYSAAVQPQHMM